MKSLKCFVVAVAVFLVFTVTVSSVIAQITDEEQRKILQAELEQLEAEIEQQELLLREQKYVTGLTQKELNAIKSDINKKKNSIKKKQNQIYSLNKKINSAKENISKLENEKAKKVGFIKRILFNKSIVADKFDFGARSFVFAGGSLSEQTQDYYLADYLQADLLNVVDVIKRQKKREEQEKESLEMKKKKEDEEKKRLEEERKKIEAEKKKKEQEYAYNKSKLTQYEKDIAKKKARAADIRAALFELRGQQGIPFGDAYEYAKFAYEKTGVEPAYILAILKQESNLGKNVGTCNRPGDALKWRDIMPGPNDNSWRDDQTAFLQITKELGISPDGQPLSCPIGSGWGGAMGPSQFIPTTWLSYKSKLSSTLGVSVPNPWNPQHAIMATALYVKDLGADRSDFESQREAACKYYSGRSCYAKGVKNMFYGNAVMSHKEKIQRDIDLIKEADAL